MLRCYHKIDNGLELSCCPPDKKKVLARFRFYFKDGLFTGQNFSLRPSDFVEEMEGFSRWCFGFIVSPGNKIYPESWREPTSENFEFDL